MKGVKKSHAMKKFQKSNRKYLKSQDPDSNRNGIALQAIA
jgi:hypothetical protein